MAVRQVVQFEPNPGRFNDMVGYMAEAKKIHQGVGWRVRAWQTIAAGAAGPRVSYVLESDNIVAFLASLEKMQADAQKEVERNIRRSGNASTILAAQDGRSAGHPAT